MPVPSKYKCYITGKIMADPVLTSAGYTYEREAITKKLEEHPIDPISGVTITNELMPNKTLRDLISEYISEHPEERDDVYLPMKTIRAAITAGEEVTIFALLKSDSRHLTVRDDMGKTAFDIICEVGTEQILKRLLVTYPESLANLRDFDVPANVNPITLNKLLLSVAEAGEYELTHFCLELGADVTFTDTRKHNSTALHLAAGGGHLEIAKLLIAYSADIEKITTEGKTPLILTAIKGDNAIVRLLLNAKANLNHQDYAGNTPLHYAMENKRKSVVTTLIEAHASTKLRNLLGEKPTKLGGFDMQYYYIQETQRLESQKDEILHETTQTLNETKNLLEKSQQELILARRNYSFFVKEGITSQQLIDKLAMDFDLPAIEVRRLTPQEIEDKKIVKKMNVIVEQMLVNYAQVTTPQTITRNNNPKSHAEAFYYPASYKGDTCFILRFDNESELNQFKDFYQKTFPGFIKQIKRDYVHPNDWYVKRDFCMVYVDTNILFYDVSPRLGDYFKESKEHLYLFKH